MIDLVFWSCVLGFSPIVGSIGWRIVAVAVGPDVCMTADRHVMRRVD